MKYQTKTRVVEAITFDELVEYGRSITPPNHLMNGMPWSFEYKGRHVTHENDSCYLILDHGIDRRLTPGDMLVTNSLGGMYVHMHEGFEAAYEPVTPALLSDAERVRAFDADTERLDWLLQKLRGDAIRCCVGELSDTCDGDEFRAAIDAAMGRERHG